MQGHNFKFHIIKIFDSRGELLFPGHKTYFLLIQCAIVPLIEKQSLVLNSAFLSNNLIKFGAFILGQNKLFWSNWSPLGDSQGLSLPLHPANFTCLKELLDLALCHICQLQSLLWPFILGECLYLHAKMTKIQTGHSSLSASNGAEMLQKHFLCHQGRGFLLCASGYFSRSCFAFSQPVRQLPRGTLWRNTPYPRCHWGGTNAWLSPGGWAQVPSNAACGSKSLQTPFPGCSTTCRLPADSKFYLSWTKGSLQLAQ